MSFYEHEQMRRELWVETAARVAGSDNCVSKSSAESYADAALKSFDKNFPEPNPHFSESVILESLKDLREYVKENNSDDEITLEVVAGELGELILRLKNNYIG